MVYKFTTLWFVMTRGCVAFSLKKKRVKVFEPSDVLNSCRANRSRVFLWIIVKYAENRVTVDLKNAERQKEVRLES